MIKTEHLSEVVFCRGDENVLEVSRILRDTNSRHLVVVDDEKKPIGIISCVDINNRVVSEEKDPKDIKAEEIMTKDIKYIELEDTYEKAFEIMNQLETNSIPVTKDKKLIGLLEYAIAFKLRK